MSTLFNYIDQGVEHVWLPYTQMKNRQTQLEVSSAKGSKIYLKDGRVLVDGVSSWWSVAHGYNHPHLIKEITKQAKSLSHIMMAGFAHEQTYKLGYRLCKFSNMDKVFFSDSGSTAIEVAMKIAWQYHINQGQRQKVKFISFKNSYHGDTTGAMSLADLDSGMHQKFKPILLDNISLKMPENEDDLNQFEDQVKKNSQRVAAIFIEPLVQCAGGMKFTSIKILKEISSIAKKYNILLIADECAVGFYRTGKRFALDHAKIKTDILVLGKALTGGMMTLAATLVTNKIYKTFLDDSLDKALMHGPTFMGNPLACSAANASLDLFEGFDYLSKINSDQEFLIKALESLKIKNNVIDVRVIGLIAVIELDISWEEILDLRVKFIDQGVFLRPFSNCIYLMPPLNINRSDLKKLVKAIKNLV